MPVYFLSNVYEKSYRMREKEIHAQRSFSVAIALSIASCRYRFALKALRSPSIILIFTDGAMYIWLRVGTFGLT